MFLPVKKSGVPASFTSLEIKNLSAGYAHKHDVLKNINLVIRPGSFTVIVGPNGSGKSTLAKVLVSELKPRQGEVFLNSVSLSKWAPRERAKLIAYVPQVISGALGVTVRALIAEARYPHVGAWRRYSPSDLASIEAAARACKVESLLERHVEDLSGGQRQKVLVAAAIAQGTDLLIVDEPTTYLDIKAQHEALRILKSRHEAGKTVIAVLHDLNQALKYATNVVVISEGIVVAQGEPRQVLSAALIKEVFEVEAHFRPVAQTSYIADVSLLGE